MVFHSKVLPPGIDRSSKLPETRGLFPGVPDYRLFCVDYRFCTGAPAIGNQGRFVAAVTGLVATFCLSTAVLGGVAEDAEARCRGAEVRLGQAGKNGRSNGSS